MTRYRVLVALALALAGCGKANENGGTVAKAPAPALAGPSATVTAPQIAYTYRFAFRLPAARIAAVQQQHLGLCDRMGPARCHVVTMAQQSRSGRESEAGMTLAVSAPAARAFGDALAAAVGQEGGETVSRGIEGEDLTKKIVDLGARLRGRQALADRLLGIVRGHSGTIADLVAAEKALADVQEEIDTARAELADAQGRVTLSTVEIGYVGGAGGFLAPIRDAFGAMTAVAGNSVATLLTLLAVLAPWLVILALAIAGVRWWRARRRSPEE
jgi:hypothetical protein